MKCIFVATTYQFSVQYHAWASVEAHADKDWPMDMDAQTAPYRMLVEPGSDRHSDATCAVFVPARMDARAAGLLFVAFTAAHPGVIPVHVQFDFVQHAWWKRTARLPPIRPVPLSRPTLAGVEMGQIEA